MIALKKSQQRDTGRGRRTDQRQHVFHQLHSAEEDGASLTTCPASWLSLCLVCSVCCGTLPQVPPNHSRHKSRPAPVHPGSRTGLIVSGGQIPASAFSVDVIDHQVAQQLEISKMKGDVSLEVHAPTCWCGHLCRDKVFSVPCAAALETMSVKAHGD